MLGKTGKNWVLRKAVFRKAERTGAVPALLALGVVLAAGFVLGRAIRQTGRRFSRSAPQPFHRLRESLEYRAPVATVFRFWTAFSDFPRYRKEVVWAREAGPSRFLFGLLDPAGGLGVWEVIVTRMVPGQYLEWYSTSGSRIQCSGRARFRSRPEGSRVDFEIEYGHGLGWMIEGMDRFLKEDLPAMLEAAFPEETASRPA